MSRSGTAANFRAKPSTLHAQSEEIAAVPERVMYAFGLCKTEAGYVVCRVDVRGENTTVTEMRQAEPQHAIASEYLVQEVETACIRERR